MKYSNKLGTSVLAFIAMAGITFGQENELDLVDLAPFNVVADGTRSVLEITERDLALRQASDLEDALSLDPSITVGGSTAVAQKIYVRSIGEAMLKVSVDGATQSGALFHHLGRNLLEPELLKRVDIQSGIGNATDGPGALGGAIRFVTKDPLDLLRHDQQVGGLFRYGYYSNTEGYKASGSVFGQFDQTWSAMLSYVTSDHDDLEDADGNVSPGSNSDQDVLFTKLVGNFSNGQKLSISFENIEETGEHLRRPEWSFVSGPNPLLYLESERDTAVFNYLFDSPDHDWLNWDTRFSLTEGEIRQGADEPYVANIESYQFYIGNIVDAEGQTITFGVDFREDNITAGTQGGPLEGEENANVLGFYLQDIIQISEELTANVGARYDMYELNDHLGQDFTNNGFSPNVGLTYDLSQEWSLRAGTATAYRGPEINDGFKLYPGGPTWEAGSVNDPNLEGESARNNEISVNYNKDGFSFELGVFDNTIDDIIVNTVESEKSEMRAVPWGNYYTNLGTLETDGFYTRMSYSGENYNISLLYDNADTTVNGHKATRYQYGSIAASIGDSWVLDASYQPNDQVYLGWNIRLVESIDDLEVTIPTDFSNGLIDKPGYTTHDFYLRWDPTFSDNLTVNLTVKNVFDKLYRGHGGLEDYSHLPGYEVIIGANEPGRDVRLSGTLRF